MLVRSHGSRRRRATRRAAAVLGHCALLLLVSTGCSFEANPAALSRRIPNVSGNDAGAPDPANGPRAADGESCEKNGQCKSGHCDNGLCCSDGKCCNALSDCGAEAAAGLSCESRKTCQGTRGVVECREHRCTAAMGVPDDTGCTVELEANDCGPYLSVFCSGAAEQKAPKCAKSCQRDRDCDPNAHCEGDVCVLDAPDGEACSVDADCSSAHCENGWCCVEGDCCSGVADCPASYGSAATCDDTSRCQGTRADAVCQNHTCGTTRIEDDSACDAAQIADSCGELRDSYCTGEPDQPAQRCAAGCTSNADCDTDAHCTDGECVRDVENGGACDEDAACTSGHCQNGFCCEAGDCCQTRRDCPRGYDIPPVCTNRDSCSGYHWEATCSFSSCWSRPIPDSWGCGLCTPGGGGGS